MVKGSKDYILVATGPYEVTAETAATVADRIAYRHYKPDELELAKDFVRGFYVKGTYYFDYYLMTKEAEAIAKTKEPPSILDIVPWMRRVDIVVFRERSVWIVEVKDRLSPSLVGQLLFYRNLWKGQHKEEKDIVLMAVVHEDCEDIHSTLEEFDIGLIVVPKGGGGRG